MASRRILLRNYGGLQAFPELRFHLEDVLWRVNSVVLYYTQIEENSRAEFKELPPVEKVAQVVAYYCGESTTQVDFVYNTRHPVHNARPCERCWLSFSARCC